MNRRKLHFMIFDALSLILLVLSLVQIGYIFAKAWVLEVPPEPEKAIVEDITYIAEAIVEEAPAVEEERVYLGEFYVTGYCACEKCCGKWASDHPKTASGADAIAGVTVGTDWNTLPCGMEIELEGIGTRVVQDKPAKWIIDRYDGRIIDLFFASHEEAKAVGRQLVKVWEV